MAQTHNLIGHYQNDRSGYENCHHWAPDVFHCIKVAIQADSHPFQVVRSSEAHLAPATSNIGALKLSNRKRPEDRVATAIMAHRTAS